MTPNIDAPQVRRFCSKFIAIAGGSKLLLPKPGNAELQRRRGALTEAA